MRKIVIVNFEKYNPPHKAVNAEVRNGGPLKWIRWQVDTHRDPDVLDLPPEERWIWPVLCGLGGKSTPPGWTLMTNGQLAREAHLLEEQIAHALRHLRARGRITYEVVK